MKKFTLTLSILLSFSLIMPGQSDSVLIDQYALEGVVISAGKQENKIMEVPVSASIVSSLTLEQDRISASTDLTGPIPNLYMPDYGSRLTSPIYIRGIGSRINAPSIGFYIDEVAMFEKAAFDMDLYNVERIEVLRGPQGTLYGRNTMGGIVHVITKDPTNKLRLKMLQEFGNYGHQISRLMVENPIIKNKLYAQISGYYRSQNGYHINQFNGLPVNPLSSGGGRMKLIFKPNSKSKWIFNIYGDLSSEGAYPYAVVPSDGSTLSINYDHSSSYKRKMLGSSLQYERIGDRMRFNSISSVQNLNGLQDIDQDFTPGDLFTVIQDQDQQLFTQELRISNSSLNSRVNWVSGIYGFYQKNYQEVGVSYGEDGISSYHLPYTSYSYQKDNDMLNYGAALFGQSSIKDLLFQNVELTLGMRIDYEKDALDYTYVKYLNGQTVPAENFVSDFSFFEVLPKVALNYMWSERHMNYISITRGYKSGGFNTTFEREEDRSFNSEFSWNYEFGWKSSLANDKGNIRLALFYIDWEDLQVYQPVPSGKGSMLKNAARAFSRGAEIEITVIPVKNLRVFGNLGYADVRFGDFVPDPSEDLNLTGNKVPYVPDLTAYLSASYRIPFGHKLFRHMVLSANWKETGKIYWNDANEFSQDAYGLPGANISLQIADFSFRVWSENLLNTSYRSFQFASLGNVYAQPGKPRMVGLTLSYTR